MRTACLLILLCLTALPGAGVAGEREKPHASLQLGQIFPDGPFQPGLTGVLNLGKSASLFVGIGPSGGASNSQNFEPSGTVGLTVRF